MSKSLYVKITQGISFGPYSIYYNAVQPNNYAFLYGTTTNAINIPLSLLTAGSGVRITIPDEATSVLIENANGDCLNYKTFSIAEFKSVTSACTGFYAGTATINVVIDGDDDLYQYSRDGGVTFSASTADKNYSFTNVPNGNHNIAVKNVSDGVTISYASNPVVLDCAPAIVATFLTNCYFIPPSDELVGTIGISATGGSSAANLRYAIKQLPSGTKTPKQSNNTFGNLDGTGQYEMYVYDNGNTVNPNYELVVGTTTFTCPNPPPPVTFDTTVACASTGYVGTGSVVANNFAGGSGQYIYLAFGTSEAEVRAILADDTVTTPRITLSGALTYRWRDLDNGVYFVGLQDSDSRITVVETDPVSCTNIEPPIKQFLAYNLITNTCDKLGTPIRRYWTYDTALADGVYKVNGDNVSLKLETVPNIQIRGFKIDSIESAPCILTDVTLTPGITFSANQYLLLVNNTAYSEFVSGTRAFPAGSVVQLSFSAGTQICGVTLNGQPYTSNTGVTLVAGTNYNFVINSVNPYFNQGAVYCEANQSKQLKVNACGNQRIDIVTPCSTACTSTLFNETCSGTYGQNVLKTFYYSCNGVNTGQTETYTCGPCSITTQDWVEQPGSQSFCVPGDCNLRVVDKQMNPCAPGYNTTRTRNTFTANCACGPTCANPPTFTEAVCGDFFVRTVTTKASCTQEVISVVNTPCSPECGANTIQEWTNSGAVQCYNSCVKKQKQIQTNPCAAAYTSERFVDVGGNTCECGETCTGQETYNFCGGVDNKDLYTVQRYKCAPNSFIGTPQLVTECSVPTCGTRDPAYTATGSTACYIPPTGSGSCVTGAVYRDTNRCSFTFNNYFILANGTYQNVGSGQPTPGACNTNPLWSATGATRCFDCVNQKEERQVNRCASGFNTTRWVFNSSGTDCNYNANYSISVGSIYSCSGGVVSSTVVYQNSNNCFTGNQWQAGGTTYATNPSQSYPNTNPIWQDQGAPYCGTGLDNCTQYQVQVNINPCSSATTQTVNKGISGDCGTWQFVRYCLPAPNEEPYAEWTKEVNTCSGAVRNNTFIQENSEYCGYQAPRDPFYVTDRGDDSEAACGGFPSNEVYCFSGCVNGSPVVGTRVATSATENFFLPSGYYAIISSPYSWIQVTGSAGEVTSVGNC